MKIDIEKVNWPVRKISIGDIVSDRLVFQVGSTVSAGKGYSANVTSIVEEIDIDTGKKSYIVCVNHPIDNNVEVIWKVVENITKMVEKEYDVSKKSYPNESTEE